MQQTDNIIAQLKEIDEEFRAIYDDAVGDGIVNSDLYFATYPKILWILKEVNDPDGGDWDMKDAINDLKDPSRGIRKGWGKTFNKIIYTTNGILNEQTYKQIDYISDDPDLVDILKKTAFINLKKTPGGATAYKPAVEDFYERHKDLILEQIKLINPDIIIGGNTFEFMGNDFEKIHPLGEKQILPLIHTYTTPQRLIIDAYHPNAPINAQDYCDSIINAVSEWRVARKSE